MKQTNIPAKPTKRQSYVLSHYLDINEDWFGWIFKRDCSFVENFIIGSTTEGEGKDQKTKYWKAEVYAKHAIGNKGTADERETIYCFFIYYIHRVYKANSTEDVVKLIEALKVEDKWDDYEGALEDARYEEKERIKKLKAAKKVKALPRRKKAA